jgi:enamine deaminase RidA (YjgF/YER057c/UK114 family)
MIERQIMDIKNVHDTGGIYSHVVRAGDFLFVSGQVALDLSGNLVGLGDIDAQARQVFVNLANALEDAGSDLANVVKMTTFLVGRKNLPAYRLARDAVFAHPVPANTLVFIEGLANPDYLVEIEAVAVVKAQESRSSSTSA